jgi:hypothetical protein
MNLYTDSSLAGDNSPMYCVFVFKSAYMSPSEF